MADHPKVIDDKYLVPGCYYWVSVDEYAMPFILLWSEGAWHGFSERVVANIKAISAYPILPPKRVRDAAYSLASDQEKKEWLNMSCGYEMYDGYMCECLVKQGKEWCRKMRRDGYVAVHYG